MQKCESRTKRVMSAIIAGMMALQVVAPTISYADDTVASTASSENNSDTQIDPGVPVQTDTASSNTVTEPDSSESRQQPPPEGGGLKPRRIPMILTQWIFTARFRPCDQVSMSFHRCCGRHSGSEKIGFMWDIIPTIQHYVCL